MLDSTSYPTVPKTAPYTPLPTNISALESLEGGPIAAFLEKLLIYGCEQLPQNTKRLVWTCVSHLP